MPEKPTICPHCGADLVGAKWSVLHGPSGPQPFGQCPSCQQLIYVNQEKP